jgi:hypothetical protein
LNRGILLPTADVFVLKGFSYGKGCNIKFVLVAKPLKHDICFQNDLIFLAASARVHSLGHHAGIIGLWVVYGILPGPFLLWGATLDPPGRYYSA